MNKPDSRFLESYKQLDALLRLKLQSPEGVNEYIARMEAWQAMGQARIPGWDSQLRTVKQLRHLRNRIAHENRDAISDGSDYRLLAAFTDQVRTGGDPLSRLHKCGPRRPVSTAHQTAPAQNRSPARHRSDPRQALRHRTGPISFWGCLPAAAFLWVILAIAGWLFITLWR